MEVWYVLEDGLPGDPNEIAPDVKGVLRHKDGRAVKYAPHGPRSRSVDPKAVRAAAEKAAEKEEAKAAKAEEKAESKAEKAITSTEHDREAYENRAMKSK